MSCTKYEDEAFDMHTDYVDVPVINKQSMDTTRWHKDWVYYGDEEGAKLECGTRKSEVKQEFGATIHRTETTYMR